MADKPTKSLAVFDIDGTVMDHFTFLAAAGADVVTKMATSRGLTADEFKERARAEAMEKLADSSGKTNLFFDVYGNPGDLVGKLDFMQPDQKADATYAHDFRREYAEMVEFFQDVPGTFQDIALDENGARNGVKVAFLTDGTAEATALKLAARRRRSMTPASCRRGSSSWTWSTASTPRKSRRARPPRPCPSPIPASPPTLRTCGRRPSPCPMSMRRAN